MERVLAVNGPAACFCNFNWCYVWKGCPASPPAARVAPLQRVSRVLGAKGDCGCHFDSHVETCALVRFGAGSRNTYGLLEFPNQHASIVAFHAEEKTPFVGDNLPQKILESTFERNLCSASFEAVCLCKLKELFVVRSF